MKTKKQLSKQLSKQFSEKEYPLPPEFEEPVEEYEAGKDEYGAGRKESISVYLRRKKRRQDLYLKFVSSVLAILLLLNVFELDFLQETDAIAAETQETETEETTEKEPEKPAEQPVTEKPTEVTEPAVDNSVKEEEQLSGEHADTAFPVLSNLMPSGSTQSVLLEKRHEERVDENGQTYQYTPNEDYSYPYYVGKFAEFRIDRGVPGASYDAATNTLTLENCYFEGDLYATRMGNGFTIRLIGENHLDSIYVDASDYFDEAYAAALTITGDGSLEVSDPRGYSATGIYLSAGGGDGCIMIDSGVTLDVTGSMYAIHVFDTTAEKGIYYLEPLQIRDGITRSEAIENVGEDGTVLKNFSLTTGVSRDDVTHVVFAPAGN